MAELTAGELLGGCRIEAVLARGGMGVVYRATQLDLQRPVALKVIAAARASDPEFRERFVREARMAAAIDHPNVVPVFAAGEDRGALYLVMRFVAGSDLHALLKAGPLAPQRAAAIVAQVGAALDAAHAAGVVHRDVKPANVLLSGDGEHAYLSDFGLVRSIDPHTALTDTGHWIGTVDFAAPEQLRGERVDARADVYSLGCVLFAALTGAPPYARGTVPATLLAHLHDPPPRPSASGAPAALDAVVARALAKAPADRYPSAGDLGRAALAAARGEAVTASERTVAVGPAAPGDEAEPPTAVLAVPIGVQPRPGRGGPRKTPARVGPGVGPAASAAPPTPATRVAPGIDPMTRGTPAAPARVAPGMDPAASAAPPTPATRIAPAVDPAAGDAPRGRRRRRRGALAALALPLAGIATVAALMLGDGDGHGRAAADAPLSAGEVRAVADAFATAYAAEDGRSLRRLLTRDVLRVLPGASVRGRDAVVREYEAQFRTNETEGYELSGLDARGGRAGRASGSYRVDRAGGASLGGRIVLGVVRDHGRARIALVALTPRG